MRKKVLITGGAGFIGHHLIDYLMRNTDYDIISLDRLDFSGNLNRLQEVSEQYNVIERKRLKVIFHDLKAEITGSVASFIGKPDIILHLAAQSHVDRSIIYPLDFIKDNVLGTAHLLEFARRLDNLELFYFQSTDEVYGSALEGVDYKERDRYNSSNPYSCSKAAGEEMCTAWHNTYNMPMIITHTMNCYGRRQDVEKYIPLVIDRVDRGQKIFIHSNPEKTLAGSRFYIHCDDVADAILFLITNKPAGPPDYGGATVPKFNITGPAEIDNLSLAKMIAEVQGKKLIYELVSFTESRPGHDLRYSLSDKFLKSLGWQPKFSLRERIEQINDWYLNNPRWLGR